MQTIATELEAVVAEYAPQLRAVPVAAYAAKPLPGKWSKQEILGHLIDSAQNNIRRLIVAQYEHEPTIVYNQDVWVTANDYQHANAASLAALWTLLNTQFVTILKCTPAEAAQRLCRTGELHSLEWLAQDYVKHLKHHLHQILDLSPVAYP